LNQLQVDNTISHVEHNIGAKGAQVFVYEAGQGRPVLLLHGSPDTHHMWLPLIAQLTRDVRCFAPDLPGFGRSTLPTEFSLSLDHMADFIHDLIMELDIDEPITLITTDFGGHYGLSFAAKYPELVCGIVISNTNFFTDYDWHFFAKLYRMPLIGELLLSIATRKMMRKTLKRVSPHIPDKYVYHAYDLGFGSPSVRRTILRMYRERNSKDFADWQEQLLQVLAQKPALVLWGDCDPFIDPAYADRYIGAEVHHFELYSHWLPLEAPNECANILLPWLKSL